MVKKPEQAIFFRRLKREHPIYNKGGLLVDGYPLITSTNPLSEKNQLIANIKVSQRPVRSRLLVVEHRSTLKPNQLLQGHNFR